MGAQTYEPLPAGEWDAEPNKVQWVDAATRLPCLIVRSPLGHLCGYAGVDKGHPLYEREFGSEGFPWLPAHGGINFSRHCETSAWPSQFVCHLHEPGTSQDVWWLGFDCGHMGDLSPYHNALVERLTGSSRTSPEMPEFLRPTYRTLGYVASQVTELAAALKALEAPLCDNRGIASYLITGELAPSRAR